MTASLDLLGLTSEELIAAARQRLPRGSGLAPRIYRHAMEHGEFLPETFGAAPATAARWHAAFRCALPRLVRRAGGEGNDSRDGGAEKAVFATPGDPLEFECVHIPMGRDRSSLCLSTQIGCRMGCAFCETARLGRLRDLTPAEIVGQVVAARALLGWDPRNLVFMGMGEPLDNLDAVLQALRVLTDRRGLGFAHDRITVCTVGRTRGIDRLAALGWKRLNLAFSLNAANDVLRARLMPIAKAEPLAALQAALQRYRRRANLELAVHYCLLPGINDAREDARGVARFCAPLGRTMVHVIPYNPGTEPLTRAPELAEVERFIGWLRAAGLPVRRRVTKGRDAMAACGQLGNANLRLGHHSRPAVS